MREVRASTASRSSRNACAARVGATSVRCASEIVRWLHGPAVETRRAQRRVPGQHEARHDRDAEAALHHAQHGVHLAALHRDPGRHAGGRARRERHLAQLVAGAVDHQRVRGQLGDADVVAEVGPPRRRDDDELLAQHGGQREVRDGDAAVDHEGDVELAALQVGHEVL